MLAAGHGQFATTSVAILEHRRASGCCSFSSRARAVPREIAYSKEDRPLSIETDFGSEKIHRMSAKMRALITAVLF